MNMLFLDAAEVDVLIPHSDARVEHALRILKKKEGDELDAGVRYTDNAFIGKAIIRASTDAGMIFSFKSEREAPPSRPLHLMLGMPRPIQAKRIIKDIASFGVESIVLVRTELGERSYMESNFYKNDEYADALIEGAMQAGNPRLPRIETAWTLKRALALPYMSHRTGNRIALDPYRSDMRLGAMPMRKASDCVLAVGSERGWTKAELDELAAYGFAFATLGDRILRTETAVTAGLSIILSMLGYM